MGIIDSVLSIGSTVLDRVITDKNAREKAKEELQKAITEQDFQLSLGQININAEEAKSENIFSSCCDVIFVGLSFCTNNLSSNNLFIFTVFKIYIFS